MGIDKGRDDYDWSDVSKDLALLTPLTLSEAMQFIQPLERTLLHPYDAVPMLVTLLKSSSSPKMKGQSMATLIRLTDLDTKSRIS